jgi:hypothetical protein
MVVHTFSISMVACTLGVFSSQIVFVWSALVANKRLLLCWCVQAHASAAVVNFSEACDSDIMRPHLDALIGERGGCGEVTCAIRGE